MSQKSFIFQSQTGLVHVEFKVSSLGKDEFADFTVMNITGMNDKDVHFIFTQQLKKYSLKSFKDLAVAKNLRLTLHTDAGDTILVDYDNANSLSWSASDFVEYR